MVIPTSTVQAKASSTAVTEVAIISSQWVRIFSISQPLFRKRGRYVASFDLTHPETNAGDAPLVSCKIGAAEE
jgi:hypothetical protein